METSQRKPGDTLVGIGMALIALGVVAFLVVLAMDGSASPVTLLGWGLIGAVLVLIGRTRRGK